MTAIHSQTDNGEQTSATLYSIMETAKANGLIPVEYLTFLFDNIPKKQCDIDALLPWNVKLE